MNPANKVGVSTSLVYAPPVPSLALDGTATSSSNNIVVNVTFSHPVEGLRAGHFDIDAGAFGVNQRTLVGAGDSYYLHVSLAGACPVCPRDYNEVDQVGGSTSCVRIVASSAAWDYQEARCTPFQLASGMTATDNALIASLLEPGQEYWYVDVPA